MSDLLSIVPPGVVTGDNLTKLLAYCKKHRAALPAVNCTSSSTINAALETARKMRSPIVIQLSNGGGVFYAGKGVSNKKQKAAIQGCISAAHHVWTMAPVYGVPVVMHTDHCAKKLLPWIDGLLEAGEAHFAKTGKPLYSSHMLDLSAEPMKENIAVCKEYLARCAAINMYLEVEIGVTGGEEDGVDNSDVDNASLYSQPEEVSYTYEQLSSVSPNFTIAAAFGNVHGVYKPGNVKLHPEILGKAQAYIQKKFALKDPLPVSFVFHGGSGSLPEEISIAVGHGVIKMNIDTDQQWAYWNGVRLFYEKKHDFLQSQIGNPKGADKPNKKFYDPRKWIRHAEASFIRRLSRTFKELNAAGLFDKSTAGLPRARL
jgi:fructose-bisphosphate aldolase class II